MKRLGLNPIINRGRSKVKRGLSGAGNSFGTDMLLYLKDAD